MKRSFIYILANDYNTVLYIGVTTNLLKRIYQHRNHEVDGFSSKYNLHKLVYFKEYSTIQDAIKREKQLKKWNREWKIELINGFNPEWKDMYPQIL
ncbi:MAG TPA: GIY-YIG nuclease family protein [Gammaproteobacteria bacterium]|jgi:putative endonuclease|nr:GIY-YIG nuclease family protein [Gammaproteobacteria bacterium]